MITFKVLAPHSSSRAAGVADGNTKTMRASCSCSCSSHRGTPTSIVGSAARRSRRQNWFSKSRNGVACRSARRRRDEAAASGAVEKDEETTTSCDDAEDDCEAHLGHARGTWERDLVEFWRDYASARDRTIRALISVAEKEPSMRDPTSIAIAGDRLRQLLPDIDVCAVFERDPSAIRVEFVSASKRVLELQDVLCSSDMCRDVTGLIERHPTLLLVDDIHAHIERAVEKLASLEPRCDARAVVNEFPELIYRIHSYDYVESLPISIQNMLLDSASEDQTTLEDYDRAWDEREARDAAAAGEIQDFFADDATEWMIDGYWEPPGASVENDDDVRDV